MVVPSRSYESKIVVGCLLLLAFSTQGRVFQEHVFLILEFNNTVFAERVNRSLENNLLITRFVASLKNKFCFLLTTRSAG